MNVQTTAKYAIDPPPIVALPVVGSNALFPVRHIYCVGRNYAGHAIEMGHDPNKEPPFFFQKNPDNLLLTGEFPYPPASKDVHHEIKMAVALKKAGRDIPVDVVRDGKQDQVRNRKQDSSYPTLNLPTEGARQKRKEQLQGLRVGSAGSVSRTSGS